MFTREGAQRGVGIGGEKWRGLVSGKLGEKIRGGVEAMLVLEAGEGRPALVFGRREAMARGVGHSQQQGRQAPDRFAYEASGKTMKENFLGTS